MVRARLLECGGLAAAFAVFLICLLPASQLGAQTPGEARATDILEGISLPDINRVLEPIDGKRVALVIGNSDYASAGWSDLANASLDAEYIARLLGDPQRGQASFDVELVSDGTRAEIQAALDRFAAKASEADIAIVYYGGHGFEFNLDNFIVPIDAPDIIIQDSVADDFINMSQVVDAAEARGFSIFFLDACRTDGPIIRTNDDTSGARASLFGAVDAPQSVVFYSTAIGDPAYDAAPPGTPLSPFAKAVAAGVSAPGLDVPYVFSRVRDHVGTATEQFRPRQIPQFAGSWSRPFFFLPPETGVGEAGQPNSDRLEPLDIPLQVLSTVDEPILLVRLLEERTAADLITLAERDDPLALYIVGYMYAHGIGVQSDLDLALTWLERAAATEHPAGELELAYHLLNHGGPEQLARAEKLLRSASSADYAKAKSLLAAEVGWGNRLQRNPAESEQLLREAAELGHAFANFSLALRNIEQDKQIDALHAKSRRGDIEGDNWLCQLSFYNFPLSHAFDHCLIAARGGYTPSRAMAARFYTKGEVVERSLSMARYWARLALGGADISATDRSDMEEILASEGA